MSRREYKNIKVNPFKLWSFLIRNGTIVFVFLYAPKHTGAIHLYPMEAFWIFYSSTKCNIFKIVNRSITSANVRAHNFGQGNVRGTRASSAVTVRRWASSRFTHRFVWIELRTFLQDVVLLTLLKVYKYKRIGQLHNNICWQIIRENSKKSALFLLKWLSWKDHSTMHPTTFLRVRISKNKQ
jgi:hypothetical protein